MAIQKPGLKKNVFAGSFSVGFSKLLDLSNYGFYERLILDNQNLTFSIIWVRGGDGVWLAIMPGLVIHLFLT